MQITKKSWDNYIAILRQVSNRAVKEMEAYVMAQSALYNEGAITYDEYEKRAIKFAYALATKYGEAAGAAACDMYDAIALLQNANVPPAVSAPTATYGEAAKAVKGTMKTGNLSIVADAVGRQVKMVSVDTMQQNALRDGAEWAWIPMGDTCAFCISLASNGWQPASKKAIKNGHAEHVHANCDCTYAVRHDPSLEIEGYDNGRQYKEMYDNAPLDEWNTPDGEPPEGHEGAERDTPKNKINAMRRKFYRENGTEEINVDGL